MTTKVISIPVRSVTHRSARTRSTVAIRDVVLGAAFLQAFPVAVNLTAVLSEDGVPDRTVPLVERQGP